MIFGGETIGAMRGPWWVAHTRPRCEKAFAWDLLARNVPYFLPLTDKVSVSGGRKRTALLPVFPSYVFFSGDDNARVSALATSRLCQVLSVLDQETMKQELAALEVAIKGGGKLQLCPRLVLGKRHRVTSGAFRGLEGILVENEVQRHFVLQVRMLGQGALLDIHADLLEPLE